MNLYKRVSLLTSILMIFNLTVIVDAKEVSVSKVIAHTQDEFEYNNKSFNGEAKKEKDIEVTKISLGKKYYTSTTEDNYEKELYYDFTIPKDGVVEVKIKNPKRVGANSNDRRLGWYVNVIDTKNINIKYLKTDTSRNLYQEYVTFKVGLKKGTYRLAIKPGFRINGDLVLKSDFQVGFYMEDKYEIEINDSIVMANFISLNTEYGGMSDRRMIEDNIINNTKNGDYFKFEVKKRGDLNILFANKGTSGFQNLRFLDANGGVIKELVAQWHMEDRGEYKQYTHKNLPAGTYYINVRGIYEQVPYKLKLNQGDTNQNKFIDISGHYGEKDIVYFLNKEYINGYEDATFRPNQSITRAEFIKIVNKTFGFKDKGTEKFVDVKDSDWFSNDVKIAIKAGYISTKHSKFRPNKPITREEVAKIIADITKCRDNNFDKLNGYKDKSQVDNWAKSSVEGVIEKGYMGKDGKYFRLKSNITRAEAIVTLNRVNK